MSNQVLDPRIEASNSLVVQHLGLVRHIAKRYWCHGMASDDIAQEGALGLIRAVREYDPICHGTFSVYAGYWIRQYIYQAVESNYFIVRRSRRTMRIILRAHKYLYQIPAERWGDIWMLYYGMNQDPSSEVEAEELLIHLQLAITTLQPLDRWIIRRRFGMEDPPGQKPVILKVAGRRRLMPNSTKQWSVRLIHQRVGIMVSHIRVSEQRAICGIRLYLSRVGLCA